MKDSEVTQLCPTLCDPMDCSLPHSSVHRIFQARVLEWVVLSFSGGSSDPGMEARAPALWADTTTLLCPQDSPGKSTGVGCPFLLRRIFWSRDGSQGSFIVGRHYRLSHQGQCTRDLTKGTNFQSWMPPSASHLGLCWSLSLERWQARRPVKSKDL